MPFYRHMETYLPASYAELMSNDTARAFVVSPDQCDCPWLEDTLLEVIVPGRTYRRKEHLSEEEIAMAALATLFTMRSYEQSLPFVVLHEVDQLVKSDAMRKLFVEYLVKRSKDRQVIMVSDHEEVYAKADEVIGVLVMVSNIFKIIISVFVTCNYIIFC